MKNYYLMFILMLPAFGVLGQGSILEKELSTNGTLSFARFKPDSISFSEQNCRILLKSILPTNDNDDFTIIKTNLDDNGFAHQYFQQLYNGIKVESGLFSIHGKGDYVESMNGQFHILKNINTTVTITEAAALTTAMGNIGATSYKWEVPEEEKFKRLLRSILLSKR